MSTTSQRLHRLVVEETIRDRLTPLQQADCAQAVADLEAENCFTLEVVGPQRLGQPLPGQSAEAEIATGPYQLLLSIQDGRCILDVRDTENRPLHVFGMAMGPFRRLMKDYALMVDSYSRAVKDGQEARIQSIDMGRRGLHNEGARLLMQRLAGRIKVDMETARRLFTLLCTLSATRCSGV